jgi:hypothetical protein
MTGDEQLGSPGGDPDRPEWSGWQDPPTHLRLVRGFWQSAGSGSGSGAGSGVGSGNARGPGGGGTHSLDDGLDEAEHRLRALLHRTVEDLQPHPGALQHIQRAVLQRQARRRQAWVGTAAALLLAVAAVPALRTAAHQQTAGGASAVADVGPGGPGGASRSPGAGRTGLPWAGTADPSADNTRPGGSGSPTGSAPAGGILSATPGDQSPAPDDLPLPCRRDQLGSEAVQVAPADSGQIVYGTFSLANISDVACTVEGAGTVQISAVTGTDSSRFAIVEHTGGDPAVGLPPPPSSNSLVLEPGGSYEVRFGFVPDSSNSSACVAQPSDGSTQNASSGPYEAADSGAAASGGAGTAAPTQEEVSLSLSHIPSPGAPAVGPATIQGACSGTVYHTGPLSAG